MKLFVVFLQDAHHLLIDGREIIVDYNRQQLMPGWIPRRLGLPFFTYFVCNEMSIGVISSSHID